MILLLSKHPIIGFLSSFGVSILLFIEHVLLPLQIIAACAGIAVGIITFYSKWLELKDRKKNESDTK
jgi:hypothetical protein